MKGHSVANEIEQSTVTQDRKFSLESRCVIMYQNDQVLFVALMTYILEQHIMREINKATIK